MKQLFRVKLRRFVSSPVGAVNAARSIMYITDGKPEHNFLRSMYNCTRVNVRSEQDLSFYLTVDQV